MLRTPTLLSRHSRPSPTRAHLLEALHAKIASHYQRQGDSLSSSTQLATQELRWLVQGTPESKCVSAAGGNGALEEMTKEWGRELEEKVRDLTDGNKPLAYILGNQPFHPLPVPLLVRPPILIPRPETERWVAELAEMVSPLLDLDAEEEAEPEPFRFLDIGTGSGCITLALAQSLLYPTPTPTPTPTLPSRRRRTLSGTAIDLSPHALSLASQNLALAQPALSTPPTSSITFLNLDVFSPNFVPSLLNAGKRFDLVISNPPYITKKGWRTLDASVREWEDRGALVGEGNSERAREEEEEEEDDGLVFYKRIVQLLPELLGTRPRGRRGGGGTGRTAPVVALEVGEGQARSVQKLVEANGLWQAEIGLDQWGVERVVWGFWKIPRGAAGELEEGRSTP